MNMDVFASAGSGGSAPLPLHVPVAKLSFWQIFLDMFKSFFTAKLVMAILTPEQIYTRVQNLEAELFEAMNQACAGVSEERKQEFASRASAVISDLLNGCIVSAQKEQGNNLNKPLKKATFKKAAANARLYMQRHLQVAQTVGQQQLSIPVVKIAWVENPAGPHLPTVQRFVVLRAAPPIENLVLRGGGAKGIGNPPALRVLENLGKLSELKKIVGTSAGALTAVCLAAGMSARAFQKLSDETDMGSLIGASQDFEKRYPEVKLGFIGFGAGKALETLDRASASSVTGYLKDHWEELAQTPHWTSLSAADQQRLVSLRDQDLEKSPRTGQMITFHDLHLLHQLVPSKFKELVLTGYNTTTKETVYFSAASHPDMPVALAGRISMSIPLFFKAVKMEVNGKTESFVDGGVGSNMPSEAILDGLHGRALDEAQSKTLLLTFDEEGAAHSILHSSRAELQKLGDGLFSRFTNERLDNEKIHFAGVNVLPIFHGKLGTFSFQASAEQIEQAQTQSMLKTFEYIENVMGGLRHDVVADAAAVARLLSLDEQNQFLQEHDGSGESLNDAVCLAIHSLQRPPQISVATS